MAGSFSRPPVPPGWGHGRWRAWPHGGFWAARLAGLARRAISWRPTRHLRTGRARPAGFAWVAGLALFGPARGHDGPAPLYFLACGLAMLLGNVARGLAIKVKP
jgi:hypothetical protein